MKRILKWIGIALLVIVVLPIAVLILVNLVDEDLDPKAAAYGAPRSASVPEAENAYYAMIAMNAPDGADGMAFARAWHNEVKAAANENRKENLPTPVRAKRPDLCDSRHTACLALIREKAGEVTQQLAAYKEDLARYETLLGYQRYEEVYDFQVQFESRLPQYAGMLNAQRAYLLRTGLDLEAGKTEQAMVALEREFAFQRMVLGNSRSLLSKVICAAHYWRALQFVNELTHVYGDELAPYMPRINALLKPLEPSALSLARTFEMEYGYSKGNFQSYESLVQRFEKVPLGRIGYSLFFKRNATLNSSYRWYSGMVPVVGASADRIEGELNAYAGKWFPAWHDYIYNPVGKSTIHVYGVENYAWRLHDLDALNRLLALRVEMLIAGVSAEQAPAFIAKSDARFHNPYTRKPMSWDAEKKRVYFDTRGDYIKQLKHGVEGARVFVVMLAEEGDVFASAVQAPGEKPENLNRARAAVGAGKRRHHDKAIQLYGEAIQFDNLSRTNLALAYRNRGMALVSDKPDRAIKDLDEALRLNPNDYSAYFHRGYTWSVQRKHDRAIEDYTQALRLNPNHKNIYWLRGHSWSEKREYDRAIEDYTQAVRLDPKDASNYTARARAWHKKREYEHAIEDYTQALRLWPNVYAYYSERAEVWRDKRDYQRAIEDYTAALRRPAESPENHEDYFLRGVAQFHAGRPELAVLDFERALKLDPERNSYVLWEYLALHRLGRDAAQALEQRAAKLDLSQWPGRVVLFYRGKIAPATIWPRAGSEKVDRKPPDLMFYLGHWHLVRGERAQAVRSFREALRLHTEWNAWYPDVDGWWRTEVNAARVELLNMGERVD